MIVHDYKEKGLQKRENRESPLFEMDPFPLQYTRAVSKYHKSPILQKVTHTKLFSMLCASRERVHSVKGCWVGSTTRGMGRSRRRIPDG